MSSYVTRKTPGETAWYVHDRFGMFKLRSFGNLGDFKIM